MLAAAPQRDRRRQAAGVRRVVYTSAPKATTARAVAGAEREAAEECMKASGLN